MKIIFVVALAFTSLAALVFSQTASRAKDTSQASNPSAGRKQETPFYCNRSAISPEQRKQQAELEKTLLAANEKVRELEDGFEFEFDADPATFQAAAEWAVMEHACCPFFDITLRLEREGGPFCLRLTGREGVKQFIQAEFLQAQKDRSAAQ